MLTCCSSCMRGTERHHSAVLTSESACTSPVSHLGAVALHAGRLLVVEVREAEGQAYCVEAQQLQPVHDGRKVQRQAV